MPGIGIVTNPHSRRNRRFPEQMRRLGYILGKDDTYELTNQTQDIARVAEEFKENQIDVLALNGGDGTNHVTLTTFIKVYGDTPLPKIAFLRGGTMNTISNAIGARGTPGQILLNLVERYYTTGDFDITERDIMKVSDNTGERYGFIFGNGLISNFLDLYYGTGNPSPSIAARLLTRAVFSAMVGGETSRKLFKDFEAEVELDNERWPMASYKSLMISTIEQIGLGWRPFTRCEERVGAFHVAAVKGSKMEVARALPALRMGRRVDDAVITDTISSTAVIRSNEEIVYTIDGDMHRAFPEVRIETGPRIQIILG